MAMNLSLACQDVPENCKITVNTVEMVVDTYYAPDGNKYTATVSYETPTSDITDPKIMSPKDISFLLYIIGKTLVEEGYSSDRLIIEQELPSVHFIITTSKEEFYKLYKNTIPNKKIRDHVTIDDANNILAFVGSTAKPWCWDDVPSNLTIVVRRNVLIPFTVVHEFMHVVGLYEFTDSDNDHKNPILWHNLSGEESLAGKVLANYYKAAQLPRPEWDETAMYDDLLVSTPFEDLDIL